MVEVGIHSLWTNRQQQNTKSLGSAIKKLERKKISNNKKPQFSKTREKKRYNKIRIHLKKIKL